MKRVFDPVFIVQFVRLTAFSILLFSFTFLFFNQTVSGKILVIPSVNLLEVKYGQENIALVTNIDILVADLREKTGVTSIRLNKNNILIYDAYERAISGSPKMRQLILGAINDGKNTFRIFDRSDSDKVLFGKTDQGTVDLDTREIKYDIEFDFADFANARKFSSELVLGSFSFGLTLFHELDHKVSYDPHDPIPESNVRPDKSSRKVRGVIENTNIVRGELALISRLASTHFGRIYTGNISFLKNTYQIPFVDSSGKRKYLRWKS